MKKTTLKRGGMKLPLVVVVKKMDVKERGNLAQPNSYYEEDK
jgi:hypothetical protein